jgi:hypothetical protein
MPVIEKYQYELGIEPRNCQGVDPSDKLSRHPAELILNDVERRQEQFLCKKHAATVLSKHSDLLAKAVVELYLP